MSPTGVNLSRVRVRVARFGFGLGLGLRLGLGLGLRLGLKSHARTHDGDGRVRVAVGRGEHGVELRLGVHVHQVLRRRLRLPPLALHRRTAASRRSPVLYQRAAVTCAAGPAATATAPSTSHTPRERRVSVWARRWAYATSVSWWGETVGETVGGTVGAAEVVFAPTPVKDSVSRLHRQGRPRQSVLGMPSIVVTCVVGRLSSHHQAWALADDHITGMQAVRVRWWVGSSAVGDDSPRSLPPLPHRPG